MFNCVSFPSIPEYLNNSYSYAAEKAAPIRNFLDDTARKVAIEIHVFVDSIDKKIHFSDDSTGETLKRVWSIIYTPPSTESANESQKIDTTTQVIKKLAFCLLITIPVAFAIKDTLQVSNLDVADASSVSNATSILAKKILYIRAIMYFANLFLSVTESDLTKL